MDSKQSYQSPESLTEKEKWSSLSLSGKIQYIWDYYKLPVFALCILLYIAGYAFCRHVTHKDPLLYAALVNVNAGDVLREQLTDGFLRAQHADAAKNSLTLYTGWYLTDDAASEYFEYTYATRMKLLAAIDAEQLDVVFLNQEAFDAFSQKGYLCDLRELLAGADPALCRELEPYLVNNIEILEDNFQDVVLDPSEEYTSRTAKYPMGIDLAASGMIKDAGFTDRLYFGILKNTPRADTAVEYLRYLFSAQPASAANSHEENKVFET